MKISFKEKGNNLYEIDPKNKNHKSEIFNIFSIKSNQHNLYEISCSKILFKVLSKERLSFLVSIFIVKSKLNKNVNESYNNL